jgi:hypothetical protein
MKEVKKITYPDKLIGGFVVNGRTRLFFGKKPEWILEKLFRCITEYQDGTTDEITAKKGFKTDGSSIPRWFWWIESPFGQSAYAAVIHDYEYQEKVSTRKEADLRFYYGLRHCGIVKWKRECMYRAVRMFGWYRWNRDK